jgi:hypothetical protein
LMRMAAFYPMQRRRKRELKLTHNDRENC